MIGALHPHRIGEHRLEFGDHPGRIPSLPPQPGQIMAGVQGVGVIGAQHPQLVAQ